MRIIDLNVQIFFRNIKSPIEDLILRHYDLKYVLCKNTMIYKYNWQFFKVRDLPEALET